MNNAIFALMAVGTMACGSALSAEVLTPAAHPGVRIEKNLAYGPRQNLPGEGAAYKSPFSTKDEFGLAVNGHETAQTYDVYYPAKCGPETPVMLYVHGGAWCMPFDKSAAAEFFAAIAESGWAVYSMNYVMPSAEVMSKPGSAFRAGATFADMLRDIDRMVAEVGRDAPRRGFACGKIALGGESAGAHLSSLYAYDQDNPKPLALGLSHSVRIGLLLNLIGPIDLADSRFATVLSAVSRFRNPERDYLTFFSGFMPECPATLKGFAKYSPINLITSNSVPTIASYSQMKGCDHDGIIPVGQFAALTNRLAACGVPYIGRLHPNTMHAETMGPNCRDFARAWYLETLANWKTQLQVVKAEPVWPAGLEREMNSNHSFVCDLPAAAEDRTAVLRYTCASFAQVWLDGKLAAFGPARGPHGWSRLDEVPLALAKGRAHRLEIVVSGYNVNVYCRDDHSAFLLAEVSAGGKVLAATRAEKGDFTCRRTARVQKVSRYSHQRAFNEYYRLPAAPSEAEKLVVCPRLKLLPRRAPLADLSDSVPPTLLKTTPMVYESQRKVVRNWSKDGVGSQRGFAAEEQELCVFEDIQRYAQTNGVSGLTGRLYEFGHLETGFPSVRVKLSRPGRVVLRFAEILSPDGQLFPGRDCTGNGIVWDLSKPGEYELTAFEPYAFKFLDVIADDSAEVSVPRLQTLCNPSMKKARYEGTDPKLKKIFEAARRTLEQCALDIFMDCPGRERAGWLCDSFFSGRSAQFFSGRTDVEKSFLENYLYADRFPGVPEGMVPMCYPADHADNAYIPNWALWFILEIDDYVRRTGDRALAFLLRSRVEGIVSFLSRFENSDGLLEKLESWVFVEWSDANRHVQDVNYPSNMLWARALETVAGLYGRPELAQKAEKIRETIRRQSYDGTWFHDNAVRQPDGTLKRGEATTETCQYYALYFGTATPKTHPDLWKRVTQELGPNRRKEMVHPQVALANAFIGNYLRMMLLDREGLKDQLRREIGDYFLEMAERTGTLWEKDAASASCCHGFASYIAVLIDRVTEKATEAKGK